MLFKETDMKNGADLVLGSEVILSGFVISDADAGWAGSDGGYFCPQMVREALATVNGPATIRLSSMGGDPFAGEAVRTIIAMHDGGVTCIVEGVAGSAASLLYMGAARRIMSAGSLLMIHDPANLAMGNEAAMLKNAALLGKLADTYAAVYAAAAGMTVEKARQIMRDETWFSAQDAFAAGFAHSVQEEPTTAHAMTMDMARASFAQMTSSMVAMIARKNSGAQDTAPQTSAAASGSPAMTAIQKEAAMPDTNPAATTAATPAVTMVAQTNPDVAVQAERARLMPGRVSWR
jgi:ATP-dependent protease ClpP protease subunit